MDNRNFMKKIIISLLFMVVATIMMAQEHLEFKGIPMDGPVSNFVSKLKTKGYTQVYNSGFGYALEGSFTGKPVTIYVLGTEKTGIVWKVVVNFEKATSWYTIKSQYKQYVEIFTQKYGSPSDHFEFFSRPYYEGDGYEMQALRNDKCNYCSYFETTKGTISVGMSSNSECLSIRYEDGLNVKIRDTEKNSSILDDI